MKWAYLLSAGLLLIILWKIFKFLKFPEHGTCEECKRWGAVVWKLTGKEEKKTPVCPECLLIPKKEKDIVLEEK